MNYYKASNVELFVKLSLRGSVINLNNSKELEINLRV